MMESLCFGIGIHGMTSSISMNGGGGGGDVRTKNPSKIRPPAIQKQAASSLSSRFSFKYPLRHLWPGGEQRIGSSLAIEDAVLRVENPDGTVVAGGDKGGKLVEEREEKGENWVLRILHAKSLRNSGGGDGDGVAENHELGKKEKIGSVVNNDDDEKRDDFTVDEDKDDEKCDVCRIDYNDDDDKKEEEEEIKFDRDSFSRLLQKVSMADVKFYAKFAYLGNLTYSISKIQPENLLRYYQLQFVTSSLEKKEMLAKADKESIDEVQEEVKPLEDVVEEKEQKNIGYQISASAAYQIAASAASYLHSQTKSILPFKSSDDDSNSSEDSSNDSVDDLMSSEMASFMATTTDSMTAVVGAKEDVKQAVADDLNSIRSSPCDWFICDDEKTTTRIFVIQGSESLASWQANFLFEPVQFEGLDVLVHRGIYEIARGIYEQMLPEIHGHLKSYGDRSTLRFTGHSLGGTLALLINLMLLIRGEVPVSSLLPVIAYGAPYVMCGGDSLLQKLGLPKNHYQAIAMHRDIVPRVFSAMLSNHVVEIFKAVNGRFRSHPCLNKQKFLFAPMGELLILQPDEKFSPNHHLLPPGSGLYLLNSPVSDAVESEKLLRAAIKVFLNSPHPLEILSDRAAYGSEGTIVRDHDMSSYLRAIRGVIRHELSRIRRYKRDNRRKVWWPTVGHQQQQQTTVRRSSNIMGSNEFKFSGILQNGRDSLNRFSRLVASQQNMHLFVVLLFPARTFWDIQH